MPTEYGNQDLTWLDSQIVGEGSSTYTPTAADVGKVIHCAVNANNGGATVWKTAARPGDPTATHADTPVGGDRAGDAAPHARHAGVVRRRSPRASRVTTTRRRRRT